MARTNIPRTKLDRLLSTDFQNPFMSNQYAIQRVKVPGVVNSLWNSWFPGDFWQSRTESLDLPFKTIAAESRHIQATNRYYAGFGTFSAFNGTFFETDKCTTLQAFVNWQKLVVDDNGNYNPASMYQAEMTVNLLSHTEKPVATARFKGVWPTQVTNINLTGSEMTRVVVQVSFSVNTVNWE
jgi:hypothetical protein